MAAALEQPAQSERSTSFSPLLARSPSLALILSSCGRKTDRVCVYGRGRVLAAPSAAPAWPGRFAPHAAKKELLEPPDFDLPASTPTPGAVRTV